MKADEFEALLGRQDLKGIVILTDDLSKAITLELSHESSPEKPTLGRNLTNEAGPCARDVMTEFSRGCTSRDLPMIQEFRLGVTGQQSRSPSGDA